MKKTIIVVLMAVVAVLGNMAGVAIAYTAPDAATFTKLPSDNGKTFNDVAPYTRNIFWNFDAQSGTASHWYGRKDSILKSGDSFSKGSNVTFSNLGSGDYAFGVFTKNISTNNTATFHLANLTDGIGPKYIWLEMDATMNKGANWISVALSGVGSSSVSAWGSGTTSTVTNGIKWTRSSLASDTTTLNAWFKIDPFVSAEDLVITFNTTNSNNAKSYINNLHVINNPEPVSMALFVTGAGVLGLRRRMKRAFAVVS